MFGRDEARTARRIIIIRKFDIDFTAFAFMDSNIFILNASENNLKSVTLALPKNKLIVVTGVSGSGKSSLVFDVLYREAENRYLGSFSASARQLLGKMKKPGVEMVSGLSPAIAVKQNTSTGNQRSTVGTLTGIYDYLRLLYARLGRKGNPDDDFTIDRSLFSFNSPSGACPGCKGLGIHDRLDPDLLVSDPSKTLREGCLVITAPNGYIIYSQVTMEVLDQVCRAEGFHTGIPWKELTPEQKRIVLYGSDKIEIPFGKHALESRMKWSGITAKPREMGYYKGIIPIMENILQRDRNKNILRFVRSEECPVCKGKRLNSKALSVSLQGKNIAGLTGIQLDELYNLMKGWTFPEHDKPVATPVIEAILKRIALLDRLGLAYLSLNRDSSSLSTGEIRRLRLATQALNSLGGVLYIFDEPSVGLHPRDTLALIGILSELRDKGNTVIVVEHDEEFIRHADWLTDIGPGPGMDGGEVLFNFDPASISTLTEREIDRSRTLRFLTGRERLELPVKHRPGSGELFIRGASAHNLNGFDCRFLLGAMNVVTGVAGAGKSTLTHFVLGDFLRHKLSGSRPASGRCREITGWEVINKLIEIDQSPIGRTPRSNPATYTGLFDPIRDLFARQPEAVAQGFDKSHFSFNTAGGRCEACEGAGYQQIGMHFMGNVEVLCETCEGRRFDGRILSITRSGKNISEVLDLTVAEALEFFSDEPKIIRYLEILFRLGLGYMTLGQRSSTLSGGEAQRIKLAAELVKPAASHTLYVLDEPTTGLHMADVVHLLSALNRLVDQGHTLILIEHHPALIASADRVIDLGPGSGRDGGGLVASGTPEEVAQCKESHTGQALKNYYSHDKNFSNRAKSKPSLVNALGSISLKGVATHNLKHIDVEIPHNKITVITGVSGSGKSSLAFDTIYAEGQNRFFESYSTYIRTRLGVHDQADFDEISGLTATFAVDQKMPGNNPRSTVGTMTGIYDFYRLLFSRISHATAFSSLFSFNHQLGACSSCEGLGSRIVCDAGKLVTNPAQPVLNGALDGTKTGKFYGDPFGQHVATLLAVGKNHDLDFSKPWNDLTESERVVVLNGTGGEVYDVKWQFKRNQRTGEHHFTGSWPGLIALVNEEYRRKHADHRGEGMLNVMREEVCSECKGARLKKEALNYRIAQRNISEISAMTVAGAAGFFMNEPALFSTKAEREIALPLVNEILRRLEFLDDMGLGYLTIDRPSASLSGGEAQRIKLAAQLGSGLSGITYVLDEPTMGLHPSDTARLMNQIRNLQAAGNTVVIVEHDRDVIMAADFVVDIGPGAGQSGGEVVASGSPDEIIGNPGSVTGPYLLKPLRKLTPTRHLKPGISIKRAFANNLKGFDLDIPSGGIIAVTGVSGSGKSSLLFDVIHLSHLQKRAAGCYEISGFEKFSKVTAIQTNLQFSGSAGTPATFTSVFDRIRELFAKSDEAASSGLGKHHFSFLNREGRCETCQGAGRVKVNMDFLSDVWLECEECNGQRFREEVLKVRIGDHNIGDILQLSFTAAGQLFCKDRAITNSIAIIERLELGYLKLGQPLSSLSGGEAQRLSLASELMKPGSGNILYLIEEPSTGLHFKDIGYLTRLFGALADQGHTLLVIEHDPDVIACADLIIKLGPAGGDKGGEIVEVSI